MFSAVFLVLAGLMLLPIGPAPTATPGPGGKLPIPWRAWIFYTLLILVALGAISYYFWLRSVLRDQGYDL
jgi:drug/metabolite transporter (DMT)-like permease